MQTHYDDEHRNQMMRQIEDQFMERLRERAKHAKKTKAAEITVGKDGEKPLAAWKASNGMYVTHMPDDEQGILRISAGGGPDLPVTLNYCTIRGGVGKCIALLEQAIAALRESPE